MIETEVKEEAHRNEKHESDLIDVILHQHEVIVRQSEQLMRAMDLAFAVHVAPPTLSLGAEIQQLIGTLANITAADMARFASMAKSLFDSLRGSGVGGGGAVGSPS
jgi:hypothetical protein